MRGILRKKFNCPGCGKEVGSKVSDTEPWYGGLKRYRVCEECGTKFVTVEKVAYISRGCSRERKAGTKESV